MKPTSIFITVVILLVAATTRIVNLGTQSLWNDEGSSYVQATRSFRDIAVNAAADIHPPGYYWALKVWHGLTGSSEFALRYLSAMAGILTVALTYGIARRLYAHDRRYGAFAGWVAAALVALNTFQIFYSQEARMYAALSLWAAASIWALIGFFYRPNLRSGIVLGVLNALGLWTQYAFPLVMLTQGAAALLWLRSMGRVGRFWRSLWAYVLANLLALALFAPLLPTALRQVTTWPNTGIDIPLPEALQTVLGWLAFGLTYSAANTSWFAVMLIVALFGLRQVSSSIYIHRNWQPFVPVLLAVIPVSIFLGAGLFREGNIKFLLPSQIGFALAVAQGIPAVGRLLDPPPARHDATTLITEEVPKARSRLLLNLRLLPRLIVILILTGLAWQLARALPPLYTDPTYQRDNYRSLVAAVEAALDPSDAIILNAPGQAEVFSYYYDGQVIPQPIPLRLNDNDAQIRSATRAAIDGANDVFLVLWGDQERDPNGVVQNTLSEGLFSIGGEWYGDVRLERYTAEATDFLYVNDTQARFGNVGERIVLDQFAVSDRDVDAGDVIQVRLFWLAADPIEARYKITLQLLDEDGQLVTQRDGEPQGGTAPTSDWIAGTRVTDNHALVVPPGSPTANYTLIIALYNAADPAARLPVGLTQEDFLTLTTITITQPEAD